MSSQLLISSDQPGSSAALGSNDRRILNDALRFHQCPCCGARIGNTVRGHGTQVTCAPCGTSFRVTARILVRALYGRAHRVAVIDSLTPVLIGGPRDGS